MDPSELTDQLSRALRRAETAEGLVGQLQLEVDRLAELLEQAQAARAEAEDRVELAVLQEMEALELLAAATARAEAAESCLALIHGGAS